MNGFIKKRKRAVDRTTLMPGPRETLFLIKDSNPSMASKNFQASQRSPEKSSLECSKVLPSNPGHEQVTSRPNTSDDPCAMLQQGFGKKIRAHGVKASGNFRSFELSAKERPVLTLVRPEILRSNKGRRSVIIIPNDLAGTQFRSHNGEDPGSASDIQKASDLPGTRFKEPGHKTCGLMVSGPERTAGL